MMNRIVMSFNAICLHFQQENRVIVVDIRDQIVVESILTDALPVKLWLVTPGTQLVRERVRQMANWAYYKLDR